MKTIGMILIGVGVIGIILGGMMFGDIGIAAWIGAITAILSGVGFLQCQKIFKEISTMIAKNKY